MIRPAGVALLLVSAFAGAADAQVFRWTDDDGVVYLTTDDRRIPERFRGKADKLEASPRDLVDSTPVAPAIRVASKAPILADAHVNGVPFTFLIDTGASRTVIAPAILARAGIDTSRGRPIGLIGVGGSVSAVEVLVPRLDLAGAQIGPLSIVALEVPGLSADGLLGRDVLEHFVLTIDPVRGKATLSR
jgi:predicted aspartyl protease